MDNIAKQILKYNKIWEESDKELLAENIERYLFAAYPECSQSFDIKLKKLEDITGSKRETVYAWLNRSRKNVKVPFIKLCAIADALSIDISDMLGQKE